VGRPEGYIIVIIDSQSQVKKFLFILYYIYMVIVYYNIVVPQLTTHSFYTVRNPLKAEGLTFCYINVSGERASILHN